VLIEAAKLAPRECHELAMLRERELEKGNPNRATLAVARKMVSYMLAVERRKQDFVPAEEFKCRAAAIADSRYTLPIPRCANDLLQVRVVKRALKNWQRTTLLVHSVVNGRNRSVKIILIAGALCQLALCQTLPTASQQLPSYEVATIKPAKENGYGFTLGMYILAAFGMPALSTQRLIGPEWIGKASYDIQGKVPDSLREAMSKMTRDERLEQNELMMQSLLADRFRLKYHFETREMQVYKLVLAKDGLKMKEISDLTKAPGIRMTRNKACLIVGAADIPGLMSLLGNFVEIGTKPIINETGLSGKFYEVSLRWTSSDAPEPANDAPMASDADAPPSLFTAIQEQLGLRLVAAKAPVKVLVVDRIEPPSPN
jgi:uncharacterized protein (TIGR03435 family)